MMVKEWVTLVDCKNSVIGFEEKMKAHELGLLHRAFSILVFNSKNELLIQRRAMLKYHCPGIWANTCCSHPRFGEGYLRAVHRRLYEEMGFDCVLDEKFDFIYKAEFDNGLTEHEYDFVYVGKYDGEVKVNSDEVMEYRWIGMDVLRYEIERAPEEYAVWFKIVLERMGMIC